MLNRRESRAEDIEDEVFFVDPHPSPATEVSSAEMMLNWRESREKDIEDEVFFVDPHPSPATEDTSAEAMLNRRESRAEDIEDEVFFVDPQTSLATENTSAEAMYGSVVKDTSERSKPYYDYSANETSGDEENEKGEDKNEDSVFETEVEGGENETSPLEEVVDTDDTWMTGDQPAFEERRKM